MPTKRARVALPAIPTMGMLTGLSYVSGVDYYRGINEKVAALLAKGHTMPRNPPMVVVSVSGLQSFFMNFLTFSIPKKLDCDEYVTFLEARDHEGVVNYLFRGVEKIDKGKESRRRVPQPLRDLGR